MSEPQPARLLKFPPSHDARVTPRPKSFISDDPRSLKVLRQLDKLAPTDATVLIIGETGTGKELAARYLHEHSGREGPFVAVNCGALSEQLIEAELFGHEAGAFTGASQARAGWFEAANGGTLFLDEIGDMPLPLQVKLLRVLQERQVVRVGARKPVTVDVRLIAATNIQLEQAVAAGRFRRDLYYRLNVAAIDILPLRARQGDILRLARHFMETLAAGPVRLSQAAELALLNYPWPGNIRELENVIQYAVIMAEDGLIDAEHLRLSSDFAVDEPAAPARSLDSDFDSLREQLLRLLENGRQELHQSVERLLVTATFEHCERNQVRTAKRLGVSRSVARAQLMRHGLLPVSSR